jgi:iron(III) transport system ATP-binding protein
MPAPFVSTSALLPDPTPSSSPEKREVGLMFQDFALFPHLTVLENVTFGLNTLKKEDQRREAMRALGRVGLAHTADDHPHMLSGGMQQRVALARAIVPRPRVMLMDEPFSGLDRRTRDRVRDETLAILREMRATIDCRHPRSRRSAAYCRSHRVDAGRQDRAGRARQNILREAGRPVCGRFFHELNEFEGVVRNGQVMTPLGLIAAPGHADGTPVLIGLRQSRSPSTMMTRSMAVCLHGFVPFSFWAKPIFCIWLSRVTNDRSSRAQPKPTASSRGNRSTLQFTPIRL